MAGDDDVDASGPGFEVELREIMQYVERDAIEFVQDGSRESAHGAVGVHIAANGDDWSDLPKALEDRDVADVAGMDDGVASRKSLDGLWPQ